MMVQAQEEMGEGLANPTDPHHIPTIIQPSTSQPQKTKQHKKPRRKVTEVPQPSNPTSVADDAINEEIYDSLERGATTSTSLDAEQDRCNISKTQSKATPNEPGSQGTSLGGGSMCQEAMGDTITQARSERVSNISNDPLLTRVNTPQSGEDSLKLTKLMEFCTKLQQRVLNLETTKTTQEMKIESLKMRVKKLKSRKRSRIHRLKRLYKGRIVDIDASKYITLVSTHDEQMFDANQDFGGEEVFVAQQEENVVEKEFDAAKIQITTTATAPTISIDEATLAQALAELKHAKPKAKAKGIEKAKMIKEPVKLKKKDQIQLDEEVALKLQAELQPEFDKEQRLTGKRAQQEVEANIALIESWDDVQRNGESSLLLKELNKKEQPTNTSSTKKTNVYLPQEYGRKEAHKFEE
uniref:Uncharacterized protein n=1 Tax=Tanacetum cinerariifolium TaxID=118510 RepID=A0A6L2JQA5_TANCI|nr:hypothetical protein [Tanacetum cinerariifolium]